MMKNQVYETLPSTYGTATHADPARQDGTTPGNYLNDHPVGLNANLGMRRLLQLGLHRLSSSNSKITVAMTGPNSSKFFANYGFFVSPGR